MAQGLTQIYTDGSSERVLPIEYIGGYGVHVPNTLDLGAPMPVHLPQTNNATEVYAVTQGLKIFPQANLALMTDSALVYLGVTGKSVGGTDHTAPYHTPNFGKSFYSSSQTTKAH